MAGAKTWQMCPTCGEREVQDHCKNEALMKQEKEVVDGSLTCRKSSQLSTVSIRSQISAPYIVYRRRKLSSNSMTMLAAQESANMKASGRCTSDSSSEALSIAALVEPLVSSIENMVDVVRAHDSSLVKCNILPPTLKSGTVNPYSVGEGNGSGESPKKGLHRTTELSSVNDSCSSSKSNVELGSASRKHEVADNGECSSSDSLIKITGEYLSERDFCVSILRRHGPLEEDAWHTRTHSKSEGLKVGSDDNFSLSCEVCDRPEAAKNMLICDNCEQAYHIACCYPRIKKIDIDEWFCHSCLKKKHKLLKEATPQRDSPGELGDSCRISALKAEWGPIAFMLRDTEPYTTGVRIGKAFQAVVSDWSGPITNDDITEELLEMDPSESIQLHELKHNKDSRVSSIGNWLQCQDVMDGFGEGVDGTICGKWRRAPLFEVQTDGWDCFRSVLWDPTHSDCAVPQELETDQVLKQLKYIEMLRSSLTAKRRKKDSNPSSQDPKSKK